MNDTLVAAGSAVVLATLAVVVTGPLGALAVGAVVIAVGLGVGLPTDDTAAATPRLNCPHCGARTDAGDACGYCGEPLAVGK